MQKNSEGRRSVLTFPEYVILSYWIKNLQKVCAEIIQFCRATQLFYLAFVVIKNPADIKIVDPI